MILSRIGSQAAALAAAALAATALHAQPALVTVPRVTPAPQVTPLPRNIDEPPALASPDAAVPARRVEVLTIDTRDTGVDLGVHDGSARAQAARRPATRAPTVGMATPPSAAERAGASAPASTAASVPAPDADAAAAESRASAAADDMAAAGPLDAPLSEMTLDALTAAAAAEASRNHNGSMVEGRITAPR